MEDHVCEVSAASEAHNTSQRTNSISSDVLCTTARLSIDKGPEKRRRTPGPTALRTSVHFQCSLMQCVHRRRGFNAKLVGVYLCLHNVFCQSSVGGTHHRHTTISVGRASPRKFERRAPCLAYICGKNLIRIAYLSYPFSTDF